MRKIVIGLRRLLFLVWWPVTVSVLIIIVLPLMFVGFIATGDEGAIIRPLGQHIDRISFYLKYGPDHE